MSTEPTTEAGKALLAAEMDTRYHIALGGQADMQEDEFALRIAQAENEAREQGACQERERLRAAWEDWLHDHPGRAYLSADFEMSMERFLRDPDA